MHRTKGITKIVQIMHLKLNLNKDLYINLTKMNMVMLGILERKVLEYFGQKLFIIIVMKKLLIIHMKEENVKMKLIINRENINTIEIEHKKLEMTNTIIQI